MTQRNIQWFDIPVIGKRSQKAVAEILTDMGDSETATLLTTQSIVKGSSTFSQRRWSVFHDKPWQHTAHTFGFLAPVQPGKKLLSIAHAGNIQADTNLKNCRIKITIDCLRIAAYPGRGVHHVLFDFYAQNQLPGNEEHLHFNATYRAYEGERSAVLGYPVFIGLNVGTVGVAFRCFTVNVKNEADESFLKFMDTDVFRAGLKLTAAAQPAIKILSEMAVGLTQSIALRNKNVPVQDFYLGLDFTNIPTRARLAEGSYIAVQIPESFSTVWNWKEWVYQPQTGQIINKEDSHKLIPYNYIVFSVSRYDD